MTDYPEHERLSAISGQSQACGEFIDWLSSRGIQLMTWREDLTDERPVDPACPERSRTYPGPRREHAEACRPQRPAEGAYARDGLLYSMQHCTHWLAGKDCCLCDKGHRYEVTGIRSWVHPGESLTDLLAEFFEIDQRKIEAEKRAMLDACRAMAEPTESIPALPDARPYAGPRLCLYCLTKARWDVAGFLACGDMGHVGRAAEALATRREQEDKAEEGVAAEMRAEGRTDR